MGILENFENAWDIEFQFESTPIKLTNNAGEPISPEDNFSDSCCNNCSCQTNTK